MCGGRGKVRFPRFDCRVLCLWVVVAFFARRLLKNWADGISSQQGVYSSMIEIDWGSMRFRLGVVVLAAFVFGVTPSFAQDKKPAATKAKPAAKKAATKNPAATAKNAPKSDWVKICDKMNIKKKDKEGKESVQQLDYCITQQEALAANGTVLYAIGLREVKGDPKKIMMITIAHPQRLGIAVAPGMGMTVDGHKDVHKLRFAHCNPASCTAEYAIKDETIAKMKGAKGFRFTAFAANGQPFGKQISLNGFTSTLEGKPLDVKAYTAAKKQMLEGIVARQKAAIDSDPKMKKAVEALAAARKNLAGVVQEKQKAVQAQQPAAGAPGAKPAPKKK